ncbi:MAG: hypothetical protein P1U34_07590 [Coxiellaceae bacterium]|nr:hypothetical protein [Coxiellaceae bacterium]
MRRIPSIVEVESLIKERMKRKEDLQSNIANMKASTQTLQSRLDLMTNPGVAPPLFVLQSRLPGEEKDSTKTIQRLQANYHSRIEYLTVEMRKCGNEITKIDSELAKLNSSRTILNIKNRAVKIIEAFSSALPQIQELHDETGTLSDTVITQFKAAKAGVDKVTDITKGILAATKDGQLAITIKTLLEAESATKELTATLTAGASATAEDPATVEEDSPSSPRPGGR